MKSAAGLEAAEVLLHQRQGFVGVDVAEDRHDHVVRHEILGVVLPAGPSAVSFSHRVGLAALDDVVRRAGRQVVAEELADFLRAGRRRGGRWRPGQAAAPWRTRLAGNVGRVKHSANRAAAPAKSSRSVVALPNTVNRPALIASWPPIESKYSAICRAEWSAVPMSSIAPTRAARPAVASSSTSEPPSTNAWMLTSGKLGVRVSAARAARWAAAPGGFRPRPASAAFSADFGAPPGGAMITRLSRCGTKYRRATSRTCSAVTF